jgi:hypothetical protein
MWRVMAGRETEFVEAWQNLADVFSALPSPPIEGTLLQSTTDPQLYYSFGPWTSAEDVSKMRSDASAQAALERIRALCVEATPGAYRVVLQVSV